MIHIFQRNFYQVIIFIAGVHLLSACNLPNFRQRIDKETPIQIDTQAAQTVAVEQTRRAPTPTQTVRPTREPRTQTPTETIIATLTNTPEPTPLPTALFADNFSENTGWAVSDQGDFAFGYAKGGYFIFVDIPNATIWSAKSIEVSDIQVQTQAARLEGPDNGYFGVMCRQQRDGFNYYIFVISSDGAYGIGKVVNGGLQFILEETDQAGIIQRGDAANRITGACIGNTLTLSVNSQSLLSAQDDQFTSGTIGLVAGIRSGDGLYILFDNFIAQKP